MKAGTLITVVMVIATAVLLQFLPPENRSLMRLTIFSTAILFAICGGLGYAAGWAIVGRVDVDSRKSEMVAWSMLGTWLVPFIGMFMSSIVYLFSKQSSENQEYYYYLCNIGGIASMLNAGIGTYLYLSDSGAGF